MALTSVFYDGPVTETDRAKNCAGAPDYGVYGAEDFKVKPHPSIPYAVIVTKGKAHGWGVTDEAATDQVVQCGTIVSGIRYDLIVARRNWQPAAGGPSTLVAIPGGDTPAIPAARKVGPGVEDDQPLALVKWKAGLSAPESIIDLRCWAGNGGMIAKDELALGYLASLGASVKINGNRWSYELMANEMPGWVNEDGSGPWVNLTLGTGWINSPNFTSRARSVGRGKFVQVSVDARYTGSANPAPDWLVASLPASLLPTTPTMVAGATDSYQRLGMFWIGPNHVQIGAGNAGKIVQISTTVSVV
ncbi:hypothetical protein ACSVHC_09010 [Arthrobacter sp. KNU-44]|uniref:hypothetical protein n=1 Tax=Arthrobacter sp. KNU-44 TaxID=3450744 RepID=UPI003F42B77A